jgi:uncharacterized protein
VNAIEHAEHPAGAGHNAGESNDAGAELPFRRLENTGLPVFRADLAAHSIFYTPGCVLVSAPRPAAVVERALTAGNLSIPELIRFHQAALRAETLWHAAAATPFDPACLTLYPHNSCNLRCSYCFSDAGGATPDKLTAEEVRAAANTVAAACRRRGRPMTVAFHGGGEPTLFEDQLAALLQVVGEAAAENRVPLVRYIATNGVLPARRAAWVAGHFDQVGLSCDGPPDIHDACRRNTRGEGSAAAVEETAAVIKRAGKRLRVRVTLTRGSVTRQEEIAAYLCATLRADEIHVEPAYAAGRAGNAPPFAESDAEGFVRHFLAARSLAMKSGVSWEASGSRWREIHGPYCNVFRDVLQLVPGGVATACFIRSTGTMSGLAGLTIGRRDPDGTFVLDHPRIQTLRVQLQGEPDRCRDCFNRYHCVRDCPETCTATGPLAGNGFRCRVQRLLTSAWLRAEAEQIDRRRGAALFAISETASHAN